MNSKEKEIIKNCIEYITTSNTFSDLVSLVNQQEICYAVNPIFDQFTIKKISSNLRDTLFSLSEGGIDFSLREKEVNNKYENKYCKQLFEFSLCNRSELLISFSGFSENHIIGTVRFLDNETDNKNIKGGVRLSLRQEFVYMFFLDSNKQIEKVVEDGVSF